MSVVLALGATADESGLWGIQPGLCDLRRCPTHICQFLDIWDPGRLLHFHALVDSPEAENTFLDQTSEWGIILMSGLSFTKKRQLTTV